MRKPAARPPARTCDSCAWRSTRPAILWCHVGRLVFAASIAQLATKIDQIMLSSADHAAKAPFAPISITGGVLADEAIALFVK